MYTIDHLIICSTCILYAMIGLCPKQYHMGYDMYETKGTNTLMAKSVTCVVCSNAHPLKTLVETEVRGYFITLLTLSKDKSFKKHWTSQELS